MKLNLISSARAVARIRFVSDLICACMCAGSPLKMYVDSVSSGYLTAFGPGLVTGVTGEPCNFTITTKDAGSGSSLLRGRGNSNRGFNMSVPFVCHGAACLASRSSSCLRQLPKNDPESRDEETTGAGRVTPSCLFSRRRVFLFFFFFFSCLKPVCKARCITHLTTCQ